MKIAVIGGGAAGIFATLAASINPKNTITIYEKNPKVGRKLLATGNGRCNLTNLNCTANAYFSHYGTQIDAYLAQNTPQKLRDVFLQLGIPTTATEDGWVYPASYSAANVVEILQNRLFHAGVKIQNNTKISQIAKYGTNFIVAEQSGNEQSFDKVIVTSGSPAHPQLGADTDLFASMQKMGHTLIPFRPALSAILIDGTRLKMLSGVRLDLTLTLERNGCILVESFGNAIFNDDGINGPAAMNISHLVEKGDCLKIRFLNHATVEMLRCALYAEKDAAFPYRCFLLGFLPCKVVDFFFQRWCIAVDTPINAVSTKEMKNHLEDLQSFSCKVCGTKSFEFAQACSGGVALGEVSLATMESQKISGLYFAGEALDIIGRCGGYNLHWAFSSGKTAGDNVNGELRMES